MTNRDNMGPRERALYDLTHPTAENVLAALDDLVAVTGKPGVSSIDAAYVAKVAAQSARVIRLLAEPQPQQVRLPVVLGCHTCPAEYGAAPPVRPMAHCALQDFRELPTDERGDAPSVAPEWCPLREMPVMLVLTDKQFSESIT